MNLSTLEAQEIYFFTDWIIDCEQSLFYSKFRTENKRDCERDIRAASGEAASRE